MKKSDIFPRSIPHTERLALISAPLLAWFSIHAREMYWRSHPEPYYVWLSEIMLQQTRVEAVRDYFQRFIAAFPTVAELAAAEEDSLLKLWEGLGYYSRVRNLKKAAVIITERYGGELPPSYAQLLSLPGIGRYTAGAIASIAFGIPVPAVDGNVIRVLSRFLEIEDDSSADAFKQTLEQALLPYLPKENCGAFNQALMELGATVCLPVGAPKCGECPLREHCLAHLSGNECAYPVKAPKKPRRVEEKTVLLLCREDKYALQRRPEKGLLSGMWQLPNTEGQLSEDELSELLRKKGLAPLSVQVLPPAVHIFTHIEWHMIGYFIDISEAASAFSAFSREENILWKTAEEIQSEIALPSAFRAYRKYIKARPHH